MKTPPHLAVLTCAVGRGWRRGRRDDGLPLLKNLGDCCAELTSELEQRTVTASRIDRRPPDDGCAALGRATVAPHCKCMPSRSLVVVHLDLERTRGSIRCGYVAQPSPAPRA